MKQLKWLLSIQMYVVHSQQVLQVSHVVDSLSAIKYAKVKTVRDENGVVVDFETEGDFLVTVTMMTVLTKSQYGY